MLSNRIYSWWQIAVVCIVTLNSYTPAFADLILNIDFGTQTMALSGSDRGFMTNAGPGPGVGDLFSVDWTGDLGASELPAGSSGSNPDHGEINLAGTAISTGTNLSFDFSLTAWDGRTQFSLIDNDYLFLGARASFPTSAPTVEVEWRATADTIDFSGWNSYAKQNLHEAVTVGSLPVSTGSGWNPILVQSSSATASVPEPSHCVAICMLTITWCV